MAELEWFFRNGWYQLGVEPYWPALGLALAWLVFTAARRSLGAGTPSSSRGVVASGLILLWLGLACIEALGATQLDLAASASRYPYFCAFIVAGGGAAIVTICSAIAAERLLEADAPPRMLPKAVRVCLVVAASTWPALWAWVFVQEVTRVRG